MNSVVVPYEFLNGGLVKNDTTALHIQLLFDVLKIELKDLPGTLFVKRGIVQAHVYAGRKSFVEFASCVRRKKQDS